MSLTLITNFGCVQDVDPAQSSKSPSTASTVGSSEASYHTVTFTSLQAPQAFSSFTHTVPDGGLAAAPEFSQYPAALNGAIFQGWYWCKDACSETVDETSDFDTSSSKNPTGNGCDKNKAGEHSHSKGKGSATHSSHHSSQGGGHAAGCTQHTEKQGSQTSHGDHSHGKSSYHGHASHREQSDATATNAVPSVACAESEMQLFDFSKDAIYCDVTLYAVWKQPSKVIPAVEKRTVTFESNGGSQVPIQTVVLGEKASYPSFPLKEGKLLFYGWYTNASLSPASRYNFNTPVENDITLYAKWTKTGEYIIEQLNDVPKQGVTSSLLKTSGGLAFLVDLELPSTAVGFTVVDMGSYTNASDYPLSPGLVDYPYGFLFQEPNHVNTRLQSVTMPDSLYAVGKYAFSYCTALKRVDLQPSIASVQQIRAGAFFGCSELTEITIPRTVKLIDEQAFAYCTALQTVRVEAVKPPTLGAGAWLGSNPTVILVPAASVSLYKAAAGWSAFSDKIRGY